MPTDDGAPAVFLIDDDRDIREALDALLRSVGLRVESFASVEDFTASGRLGEPGCLLLDVRLSGQSGLSFQAELASRGIDVPIIFMSGHADVPMAVRGMKAGAIEFLTKPLRPQDLIDAVNQGLARDVERRGERAERDAIARARATLTQREREVMDLVASGHSNRAIADTLGLSEATVKVHRAHVMQKMGAGSLAHLVTMAQTLKSQR
ncbi:DNA-binding response regulator [Acuticoccus sediminis]|uniref:DNA-binding response regulator n=1 Tax=Acuticoccus sediminis TaxID=2184697 RepID=A0A8B2NWP0_9HYPH|nr:response regulator [Acuticoccus sediminis]RAI01944.1 DNA-binding response regulator [Acuticoccus sediminis]